MYTRNLRRAVIGIIGGMGLLVVSLLSTAVSIASAHSYPVRSLPAADSVLSASPKTVSIWFSELPQSGFSEIDVFDQTLKQVDLKNSTVSADQLSVGVPDTLSTGTYTVRWSAVSAVDGHHTTGAFVFAVGEAISGNAAAAAQAAQTASSANPVDAIVKWLDILSLTALCGAVLITLGVLRPMFGVRGLPDQLSSAIGWLLYAALIASVFGAVAGLFAKMISLYGADLLAFAGLKRWLARQKYGAYLVERLADYFGLAADYQPEQSQRSESIMAGADFVHGLAASDRRQRVDRRLARHGCAAAKAQSRPTAGCLDPFQRSGNAECSRVDADGFIQRSRTIEPI